MRPVLTQALRELGPGALLRFGQYRLGLDSGWIRRQTPIYDWSDRPLSAWLKPGFKGDAQAFAEDWSSSSPGLFLPASDVLQRQLSDLHADQIDLATSTAEAIAAGRFLLFGMRQVDLGFPPDWHRFAPLDGDMFSPPAPTDKHWTEIDLLELPADVKLLWELNRFGWVYPLARAYVLTGENRYVEVFWELLQSWRAANPPNLGLNWHSAQEVSIRMLALIFACHVMRVEFRRHPERLAVMVQTIAAHAERIPATLSYAIAQGNNHLLVEAAGLFSAGSLFPELRQSGRWRAIGLRWFIRAMRKQVFPDGGYIQQSVNYHRLALQTALWTARLASHLGKPLPQATMAQIERMTAWLDLVVDRKTGAVPHFGPNDGAEILPLSMQPFDDYRPTLQAAARLLHHRPLLEPGAWDEWGLWLGLLSEDDETHSGRFVASKPDPRDHGLHGLHGRDARGYLRATHFTHRPGHADQLHLDLWFGPLNVAMDAGTYLYNAEPPWDNALAGAAHHNTALVDGSEAMTRAGRFLWLNWNQAAVIGRWRSESGELEVVCAERTADLSRELTHRRTVVRAGDRCWGVIDDLLGVGEHQIELGWLLPDLPWQVEAGTLKLSTPVGVVHLKVEADGLKPCIIRAGERIFGEMPDKLQPTFGWFSPTYALKHPALHFMNALEGDLPLRIQSRWTWLQRDGCEWESELNPPSRKELPLRRVRWDNEHLELSDAYSFDPSGLRRAG